MRDQKVVHENEAVDMKMGVAPLFLLYSQQYLIVNNDN